MFDFPVICYLFAGGLGGGLAVVCAAAMLFVPKQALTSRNFFSFRRFFVPGFVISAVVLIVGALFLLTDLGSPQELEVLVFSSHVSYLNIGAWALALGVVACVVQSGLWASAYLLKAKRLIFVRVFAALTFLVGLAIVSYTGIFLAVMKAVPLWNSAALPALFVASSLSCGVSVALFLLGAGGNFRAFRSFACLLSKVDIALIVLEVLSALWLLLPLLFWQVETPTDAAALSSVQALLYGPYAWLWWVGFVAFGLVIMIFIDRGVMCIRGAEGSAFWHGIVLLSVGALCACVGAFAMRASLILAGAHPLIAAVAA